MVSSGAAAGIALGPIFGVLLFSISIAFYLVQRKRQQVQNKDNESRIETKYRIADKARCSRNLDGLRLNGTAPRSSHEGGVISEPSSTSGLSAPPSLTGEDEGIRRKFHELNMAIKKHVKTSYHVSPIQDGSHHMDKISSLNKVLDFRAPIDGHAMQALLHEPKTRIDALRVLIAWVVLKEFVVPGTSSDGGDESSPSYRVTVPLATILEPYAIHSNPHPGSTQDYPLSSVLQRAADFKDNLFSVSNKSPQETRTAWELSWTTLMSDELVVFPALVKMDAVHDDDGADENIWEADDSEEKVMRVNRRSVVLESEETVKFDVGVRLSRLSRTSRLSWLG